jgi:glycosyltransferase involved in cell wall biosynthesis
MFIGKFDEKYIKRKKVDYDIIIIISSYNRFEKLDGLLCQLYTQETNFKIKIIVYNDGSTDNNYNQLMKKYNNINYIYSKINNGKFYYWKSINKLFNECSKYICHAVIQIDDDFILCDNFIDKLMGEFFKSKEIDNRYVAIHYHNNTPYKDSKKTWWGFDNGIDGGAIFDIDFLKIINFKIDPIYKSRWDKKPMLSSGVWHQITIKINKFNLLTYKLNYSLVYHNGNGDSKMNQLVRNKCPLKTPNFKQNDSLLKNEVSIIIPAWKADKWINDCLQSIYDQSWFKDKNNKWEILVGIDNCEKTKFAALPKENTKLYFFKEHYGPYVIRNTLAYNSKYDNLLFFDSDDLMHPDLIKDCFELNKNLIRFQYIYKDKYKYT